MPHITKRWWKQEPATASKHLLVGMKIAIQVLPLKDSHISKDARSCVNDDCLDLPTIFAKLQNLNQKKSHIGDFEPSDPKTAALHITKW